MKTLTTLALFLILVSCKKEGIAIIIPGKKYKIKQDNLIFNKGAFQPMSPALVLDLYIEYDDIPYAHIKSPVNWAAMALEAGNGVKQQTIEGNRLSLMSVAYGDTTSLTWSVPQWDLEP